MYKLILIVLLSPVLLYAQGTADQYGIKDPGKDKSEKCGEYLSTYKQLPSDVRYGIKVEDGVLLFHIRGIEYFHLLFGKNSDGIAIDIINRSQYDCDGRLPNYSGINRGYLMKPMFKDEMMKNSSMRGDFIVINYGVVPSKFDLTKIEFNLIVVQKKYSCGYHTFSHLDYNNWGLIEMGLFRDSLSISDQNERRKEISKTLTFTIPFRRNEVVFDAEDIKPVYDSLELTDYNIIKMDIRAYSSIEGTSESNIEIQNGRARSIVSALQHYQTPEISFEITANENWVEFLNDITGTKFEAYGRLSKSDIKSKLNNPETLQDIEPMLQKHRKAIIELQLQKRFTEEENDPLILKKFFDQSIKDENIDEALYIQQIILQKIRNNNIPEDFIGKLEVPMSSLFGPIHNNFAIYIFENTDTSIPENIKNFERLLKFLPGNVKVKYNLTALTIKAWAQGDVDSNGSEILNSIEALKKLPIDESLIRRLQVNYYIVKTQDAYQKRDYKTKDKAIREVYWLYNKLTLSDWDRLSLAKYLSYYSQFEWAETTLEKRIKEIDVQEELIFYYITLTIGRPDRVKQSEYRTFILNAIDKNNARFCDLFLSNSQGGFTFQLLDSKFLRDNYCENCDSK